MRRILICIPLAGVLALGGCSDMNQEQQRTLSGGAIGAAAGAAGGYLFNQYKQGQQNAYDRGYAAGQQSG